MCASFAAFATIFFRPKNHFAKFGLSKAGLESIAPDTRPDVLKLTRAVEDALIGMIYADDAQIVEEHLFKCWGEPARVEIELRELVEVQSALFGEAELMEKTA